MSNRIIVLKESEVDIISRITGDIAMLQVVQFPSGEIHIETNNSLINREVIIFHRITGNINESLLELLLIAMHCEVAISIEVLIAYLPYSRSTDVDNIYKLLRAVGVKIISVVEIHAIHNNINNIEVVQPLLTKIDIEITNSLIISPDIGGILRATKASQSLMMPLISLEKTRINNLIVHRGIVPTCYQTALIIDDIIDSGQTLLSATNYLLSHGYNTIIALAIHPVLSLNAIEILNKSPIDRIYVTNTIIQYSLPKKFIVIDINDIITEKLI